MINIQKFKNILYSCKTEDHIECMYKLLESPYLYEGMDMIEEYQTHNHLGKVIREMKDYLKI